MDTLTSHEFQRTYQRLSAPVTVSARWRTLGTWYPDGTEPDFDVEAMQTLLRQRDEGIVEIKRLKKLLAERAPEAPFTNAIAGEAPRRGVTRRVVNVPEPAAGPEYLSKTAHAFGR